MPANVTRIGEDGLALCTPTTVQTMSSDIVYIIDNSASMSATSFWVDPISNDTSFYIQDCLEDNETAAGTWVPLRWRHYGGTTGLDSIAIDSLYQFTTKKTGGSCLISRDPYNMRAQAVRVALDYQASFDSTSMAGVVYFNSQVRQKFGMQELTTGNLETLLRDVGYYYAGSGTRWAPPFDTAFRWLNAVNTGRNEAIILVSDGEPSDRTAYMKLLGQDGQPPIYAIYLGDSTDLTPQLDTVVALTFGKKFVVPPDRPDSLEGVIKSIVASVTRKDAPAASTIANVTNGQTSRTLTVLEDSLETWRLGLDSAIALLPGLNQIASITTWKTPAGVQYDTTVFAINVVGPVAPGGETPVAGSALSAVCTEGSSMRFVDASGQSIAQVAEGGGPVGIVLTPSGEANLPLKLSITSNANDLEKVSLSSLDSVAPGSWGRTMPLSVARLAPAIPGNQTLDVVSGYDTLRSAWCHPRDARDCADAMLPVVAVRDANIRWLPRMLPGSGGSFVLEAVLPGQAGTSVQAEIRRHGIKLGNAVLVRVQDSLFRDTVHFLQGSRRPGLDTLWLNAPSATLPDSLVALLVWGLDNSILSDTATIVRPPLSLSVDWTGVGANVAISLVGGQADSRGARQVRLSAGSRSQLSNLDTTGIGAADVTVLAATGTGQTWIRGIFVDPVYGDTAIDSVLVPAPSSFLQFTPKSLEGPVGTFAVTAQVPGLAGETMRVVIWRRGRGIGTITLARQPDSSFAGVVSFRQGSVRPLGDTLWMSAPPAGVPDTLAATFADATGGDTLSDTALVRRPAMRLDVTAAGTILSLSLVGGQSDVRGARTGSVLVSSIQQVSFDSAGIAGIDLLSQLSKVSGSQALAVAWFVDPVYGDTARDSAWITVPSRSIRFVTSLVDGPRNALSVEAIDPWSTGETRDVVIVHGRDSAIVRLQRSSTGTYVGTVPFTQASSASGDTLTLGRPQAGTDSVFVVLARKDSLPALGDRASIRRPPLSLVLVARNDQPQTIQMTVVGGTADVRGEARVQLSGPAPIPVTVLASTGDLSWSGLRALDTILPESPDPVQIEGLFVDPLYGDTARATLLVVSPWFPASITVSTNKADPRNGDTLEIRVNDKDAHPAMVDTVVVQVGRTELRLVETGKNTGEYVLRTSADKLDPDWETHEARNDWRVDLVYTDPDHPRDVVTTAVVLEYSVPPPEADPVSPVVTVPTESRRGKPHLEVVRPNSSGSYSKGDQGVELKIWEHTRVATFVYDKIGTFVTSWEGVLDTENPDEAARYLIKWDGCDRAGNPTAPGIYLVRVVMVADDGAPLGNYVFRLGRKAKD